MYIGLKTPLKRRKTATLIYFGLQVHQKLQLKAAVDQKALVRSRNRAPSTPHPGGYGGWRRA